MKGIFKGREPPYTTAHPSHTPTANRPKPPESKERIAIAKKYQGFVALPRSVQQLPIWGNAYDTALWLYCVLHASHQPYKGLQPGQFYASQAQIATQLHWARKTVGTALQRLAGKALLDVNTSDKGTIITVMYWEEISSGRGFQEEPPRKDHLLFPLPAEEEVGGRIKWISR